MEELEGQLAVDVYQTADAIVVKAPIAGVQPEDLDVSITDMTLTIRGERRDYVEGTIENYSLQECYWGAFTRSIELPVAVDPSQIEAKLSNGVLTVQIQKVEKSKKRSITVKAH